MLPLMNEQLQIAHVRHVLIRLEETIIFALIERAQFLRNEPVYTPGFFGSALGGESLCGFLLRECECSHAKVRRYTSPDEHPFFTDLPEPILPLLGFSENPLARNAININPRIRQLYEGTLVPLICAPGDDRQYGSSAVGDVACLQALSKRVHYGKFVAESKYLQPSPSLREAMQKRDPALILSAVTDEAVERQVIERVSAKAGAYTAELNRTAASPTVSPGVIAGIYRDWIIPLNKDVQVQYLLQRTPVAQGA
jgi:chorismate mutase